jgi:hypothetical protein
VVLIGVLHGGGQQTPSFSGEPLWLCCVLWVVAWRLVSVACALYCPCDVHIVSRCWPWVLYHLCFVLI